MRADREPEPVLVPGVARGQGLAAARPGVGAGVATLAGHVGVDGRENAAGIPSERSGPFRTGENTMNMINRADADPMGGRVPTLINPAADLAVQPDGKGSQGKGSLWFDSIFVCGQVSADGHDLAYLVQVIRQPESDSRRTVVTITDSTTGWFRHHNAFVAPEDFHWAADGLEIRTPELTWSGDARRQHLRATTPWGALDLTLQAEGPVLYYGGTGTFQLLDVPTYQYALPQLRTTGTLSAQDRTFEVTGESWLDRQWGPLPDLHANRWTWFSMGMPGGDKIAIWDIRSVDGAGPEDSWATILRGDGTHELVSVTPVARDAGRFLDNPGSTFVYPTEWIVTIPSRGTRLTVTATLMDQEVPGLGGLSLYEGACTFAGVHRGAEVSGHAYVEQLGNWSP